MRPRLWFSLASLLLAVGPADGAEVTVYRCQDAQGRVTLQDAPCPAGQQQEQRQMVRPQDPPPRPAAPAREPTHGPVAPETQAEAAPVFAALPPPPLYRCTAYDGEVRYSENYDPNPRCVPLAVLGYDVGAAGAACRWVEDSCVLMDETETCEQFKRKLKQAESDALHAFSDTAAYRKSEVARLRQIVDTSCR